jgi:cysteinyl-tRNA synthetase
MIYKNILDLIGNTPLVKITKLNPNKKVNIYAKLEGQNPGGSIKDRIAQRMITQALESGKLTKDKTVIEASSGNTGIGLALVCAGLGLNIEIVMSASVSIERRKLMEALGAKVILSPFDTGTDGAIKLCKEIIQRSPEKYYLTDQYSNKDNYMAHYHGTAQEIITDLPDIDYFVASLGTSGTLMGCSKRLKGYNNKVQIISVEPTVNHKIQGLKNLVESEIPAIFNEKRLDQRLEISDNDAYELTRRLAREEGIFTGMSSGAALAGALKISEGLDSGNIVVIFPDKAEKYLSTSLFKRDKMAIKLHNTLTNKKEDFVPLVRDEVKIYSCGPTVYNFAHIGNFRSFLFTDLLKRYLKYKGYKVIHVMNITDVDDKTIKNSKANNQSLKEFTEHYTSEFFKDFESLKIQMPDIIPKATECIDDMIELIQQLLDEGYAYKSDGGSIYFEIKKFKDYGQLSNISLEGLEAGARVSQDEYEKGNLSDFALWKAYSKDDGDVFWDAPFGKGRPGWHIECSAMSKKYLGEHFDIHTGGVDLVFPHHENEIAQSKAISGKTMANYWLHCEHLLVDNRKMSKSLGNFYTIRDLLDKGFKPIPIRYALISTNYKQQMNFNLQNLESANHSLQRLNDFILKLKEIDSDKNHSGVNKLLLELKEDFEVNMDDNLRISATLGAIFEFIKKVNKLIQDERLGKSDAALILAQFKEFDSVLGIMSFDSDDLDKEIEELIKQREQARIDKDFKKADEIRDTLLEKGIVLEDTNSGTRWKKV